MSDNDSQIRTAKPQLDLQALSPVSRGLRKKTTKPDPNHSRVKGRMPVQALGQEGAERK